MNIDINQHLTQHFTIKEAVYSRYADEHNISNLPNDQELATIARTAMKMEEVRKLLGNNPIIIYPDHSWFRSEEVNKAVGGVSTSQHRYGEAVDFVCPAYGSINKITQKLVAHADALNYDQLILEPGWVHISFLTSHNDNRKSPRKQFINLGIQ